MKRIFYSLALAAMAFASCKPLNKTYDEIGDIPAATPPTIGYTLVATDYKLLNKGAAAYTKGYFGSLDTVKAQVPTILSSKYPTYAEKSKITVTYSAPPVTVKLADSVFANITYTLLPADYTLNGGTTTFTNFSATQIITWLGIKYPGAAENKIAVLTFNFFDQGATTTAVQQSFLYAGGAWTKLYHLTPAQYTLVGRGGNNNDFVTADAANLPLYFNTLLKADPTVSVTAKTGDIKNVSFKYFQAATGTAPNNIPAVTSQRVLPLTFDGTNWTTIATPLSLSFVKTNGIWVADNTVNYKLTTKDYANINDVAYTTQFGTIGSSGARANVASFGDFNLSPTASTTTWVDADVNLVLIQILLIDFKATAIVNQKYVITYLGFSGSVFTATKTYIYDGTTFVLQK